MIFPTISLRIERWKFNKDYGIYVSTLGNFKDRYKRILPIKVNTAFKHKNFEFKVLEGICKADAEAPDMEEAQEVVE